MLYRCVDQMGVESEVEAHSPEQAARKFTTSVDLQDGEVSVLTKLGFWRRYVVFGSRYVVPIGRGDET